MTRDTSLTSEFDEYAEGYDHALARGLSITGEAKDYFARERLRWLKDCLARLQETPRNVLDYGCGNGSSAMLISEIVGVECVTGLDASVKLIAEAQRHYGSEHHTFLLMDQYRPAEQVDLVYCNGVFHHIPAQQRLAAVEDIYRSLRPGGYFALWENNPWNPGTRYVMSRIPFDRDAVTLTPPETRRLLCAGGFEVVRTDFLFIFPKALNWLRWIEPTLSRFPLGAQYQILGRKPNTACLTDCCR
jgi:SAM-dependent methyltransferase